MDVNYCARVDCGTLRLIIPLSISARVYAFAFLLVVILLYVIVYFFVWYANWCWELVNVPVYLDSL